jgi:hypothetical protein
LRFHVSTYPSLTEVAPREYDLESFRDLVYFLGAPKPYLDKKDAPLFSPHTLAPHTTVSLENVVNVTFAVLDLDEWEKGVKLPGKRPAKGPPWPLEKLLETVSRYPCDWFVYSSFSNPGGESFRGRVVLPLSRVVLPSEWPRLWVVLNEEFGRGRSDPQCKDASHRYYAPAYRDGGGIAPLAVGVWAGEDVPGVQRAESPRTGEDRVLNVDELLLKAPAGVTRGGEAIDLGATPTKETLKWLATHLQKSTAAGKKSIGAAMAAVAKGESYADPGERDAVTYRLAAQITARWPYLDVKSTVDLFAPSLQLMGDDAPTLEQVEEKIKRLLKSHADLRGSRIREAFRSDRTEPYTPDEIMQFCDQLGCELQDLRRRWVIVHEKSVYIFINGGYKRLSKDNAPNAAVTLLAPAITANVDPYKTLQNGTVRPKSADELAHDYGTIVGHTAMDLRAQYSRFDAPTDTLVLATAPRRDIKPKWHPAIDKLFRLQAQSEERYMAFMAWLSNVPNLDKPLPALYFFGERGTGKSLFAAGLAKIWCDAPLPLSQAFSRFNDAVARCPVLFGDEVTLSAQDTEKLRLFTQGQVHHLDRKNHDLLELRGCVRIVLAANNDNLLRTHASLTRADIDALSERIISIETTKEVREYLESLPHDEIVSWVRDDKMAEHIMFIAENAHFTDVGRFSVRSTDDSVPTKMVVNSGIRGKICEFLCGFLSNPKPFQGNQQVAHLIRVLNGELLVNAKALSATWEMYCANDKDPPRVSRISHELGGLCQDDRRRSVRDGARVTHYRAVDTKTLVSWAEQTQFADTDALLNSIASMNEIRQ